MWRCRRCHPRLPTRMLPFRSNFTETHGLTVIACPCRRAIFLPDCRRGCMNRMAGRRVRERRSLEAPEYHHKCSEGNDSMTAERSWFPLTGAVTRSRGGLVAAAKAMGPIDPLSGPQLALAGRVVTMDDGF